MNKCLYILLISFIIAESETWYTNPLDYVFSRTSNRTTFREPVEFTPFDVKVGTFEYGGSDYWSQGFGDSNLGISPLLLDSSNYEYSGLSSPKSRKCYLLEVDILKYNIPNYIYKQNYVEPVEDEEEEDIENDEKKTKKNHFEVKKEIVLDSTMENDEYKSFLISKNQCPAFIKGKYCCKVPKPGKKHCGYHKRFDEE